MPNGVKTRFAGLLRELLRRFDENETGGKIPQAGNGVGEDAPPMPAAAPQMVSTSPMTTVPPAAPKASPANVSPAEVDLALPAVLEGLPPRLRARLTLSGADLGRATISISLSKIMSQLAQGAVKITFGELRQAAPTLFNIDEEYDSLPVTLPLNEILTRLSPNSLARNPAQKMVVVPEDITGPFNERGEGISFTTAPLKPQAPPAAPPIRMATPPARTAPKVAPPPVAPPPPQFVSRSITPERPAAPPANNGNGNGNGKPSDRFIPAFPIPFPAAQSVKPPAPTPPKPIPAAPKPVPAMQADATILASLAGLSENWPESLRQEIAGLISADAQVALPINLIEPALKRGRVTFAWQNVRGWIKPHAPGVSAHDNLELELPLKVVAPLFFARGGRTKAAKTPQPGPVPDEIPNLFFGFPQPQPPEPVVPQPKTPVQDETRFASKPAVPQRLDTNFYSWNGSDTTCVTALPTETEFKRQSAVPKMPAAPATDFSSRFTPPKEIVSRAMMLAGVAGSLVALPDGLMVASKIPSDLNGETLAAFLPQIYGRVSQCTKELRMGEMNNLTFTVGNVPWKIFRIHGVFFAAFGRAGEQLPTAQLALLAAELDRKKQ